MGGSDCGTPWGKDAEIFYLNHCCTHIGHSVFACVCCGRCFQHCESLLSGHNTVGRSMKLGAYFAQRAKYFWREHNNCKPFEEEKIARYHAETDFYSDNCCRESGDKFKRCSREKSYAECLHRRMSKIFSQIPYAFFGALFAPKCFEGAKSAEQIEKLGAKSSHCLEALPRIVGSHFPDKDHKNRNEWDT